MLKIKVWFTDEETGEEDCTCTLRNLRPRRYMCSYSFEQMIKYTAEELYWNNIDVECVTGFEIVCEKEQWVQYIDKQG